MIRGSNPFHFLSSASRLLRGFVYALLVIVLAASFLACAADEDGIDYSPRRTHRQSRHRVSIGTTHCGSAHHANIARSSTLGGGLPVSAANTRLSLSNFYGLLQPQILTAHVPDVSEDAALPRPPPPSA